ncbi:MAG: alpha/beta fold hydrolase [Betaproteobacteria bacterium]|jgi:polyhydroxyalkanoate synthase|nr:alpha/beta fold hydrolase [Betaproteobacteria bacterium]
MNHPPAIARAWTTLAAALERSPGAWQALGRELTESHLALWQAMVGQAPQAAPDPELPALAARDRRFSAPAWQSHPWFDYLRQAHLLNERWLERAIEAAALDPADERHARFFLRQWLEAISPANFAPTNPEVLELAASSGGESLARGLQRAAEDTRRGALTMTDEQAFAVGRNLALTPGSVIHRNEIVELIHYRPVHPTVHARPLVIVPPFINKYYILDLQPGNSFVRFALEQGFDVYILSWRNAPAELGHLRWEDYARRGVLESIGIARAVSRSAQVNTLGFCVGGTLLSTALALAAARGEHPAASTTLLATMLDFSDVGDIGVYIDRDYVEACERRFDPAAAPAVMRGRDLAFTFASLRANDLIWRFVVDHWLKGKAPEPFDLLYWNSDGTSLPGVLYAWYLRQMYYENNLRHPGRVQLDGVPLDLRAIKGAWYLLAAEEDHIVPWRTAWLARDLLRGSRTFVLAASGHIAGVVNPAAKNRRHFYAADGTAGSPARTKTPEAWRAASSRHEGSWWTHWAAWLKARSGRRVKAPDVDADPRHPPLCPAPGRYVLER